MTFKAKVCALLVTGLLATGAITSNAQATPLIEADSYTATIDGTALQHSVFAIGGIYQWECKTPSFQGSLTAASSTLTLTPSLAECSWHWPITEPASVVQMNMNGCDFRLSSIKFVEKHKHSSLFNLECPVGKQLVIEMHSGVPTICTLTVPAQSSKSETRLLSETNKEGSSDDDIRLQLEVSKMKYTQDSASCPVKVGTYEDFSYLGDMTLKATKEAGKQIGLRVTGE